MSGTGFEPVDSEKEFEQRAEQLIQDAKQTKQELEAEQSEALEAISEGEDFESYDMVELGELEMEVKAWLPGYVEETVQEADRLAQGDDMQGVKESMQCMLTALDEMTVSDTYNQEFWQTYYSEFGAEGMIRAVDVVLDPATESLEDRRDAVESFRRS